MTLRAMGMRRRTKRELDGGKVYLGTVGFDRLSLNCNDLAGGMGAGNGSGGDGREGTLVHFWPGPEEWMDKRGQRGQEWGPECSWRAQIVSCRDHCDHCWSRVHTFVFKHPSIFERHRTFRVSAQLWAPNHRRVFRSRARMRMSAFHGASSMERHARQCVSPAKRNDVHSWKALAYMFFVDRAGVARPY